MKKVTYAFSVWSYKSVAMTTHTHLWELLELALGVLQAVPLHVVVRRVGQQLMERDDVPWNLKHIQSSNFHPFHENVLIEITVQSVFLGLCFFPKFYAKLM